MRVPLLVLLSALAAAAQTPERPEIQGTVIEYGPNTGIAGATVTLTERVFYEPDIPVRTVGSVITDARGQFSFKPGHYGDFYLAVSMAGYTVPPRAPNAMDDSRVMAMNDEPRVITLTLLRPGSLTGRFVDGDGKPIAQLAVSAVPIDSSAPPPKEAMTDSDGFFIFADVLPRSYVVRPLPAASTVTVQPLSTSADADKVDEDFESTYWPGGASAPRSALPVKVNPAGTADVGTIRLRRVSYYRIRVPVQGACAAGEKWTVLLLDPETVIPRQLLPVSCSEELLVRNVQPGSYSLALFGGNLLETKNWALARVFVGSQNVTSPLTLAPTEGLRGRLIGAAKPAEFFVETRALDFATPDRTPRRPDAQGRFLLPGLAWPRHKLVIDSLNPAIFVKEVRYNYLLVTDGLMEIVPGAELAITVDEGAASVTGKVSGVTTRLAATIFLTKWPRGAHPPSLESAPPFQQLAQVEADGTFRISSLPPGVYRIAAFSGLAGANIFDAQFFNRLILQAETITLERGATKTIDLKLADLSK